DPLRLAARGGDGEQGLGGAGRGRTALEEAGEQRNAHPLDGREVGIPTGRGEGVVEGAGAREHGNQRGEAHWHEFTPPRRARALPARALLARCRPRCCGFGAVCGARRAHSAETATWVGGGQGSGASSGTIGCGSVLTYSRRMPLRSRFSVNQRIGRPSSPSASPSWPMPCAASSTRRAMTSGWSTKPKWWKPWPSASEWVPEPVRQAAAS